jgi:predicted HicB family RNase H-like nuclease
MVSSIKTDNMERLEYKGYVGSIEYNKSDNCLHGQVLGLSKNICIIYEGNTAEELYNDFRDGIEHYLDDCKAEGIQPEKSFNRMLNIFLPSETHFKAVMYAEKHGTSIDVFVNDLIEKKLEAVS